MYIKDCRTQGGGSFRTGAAKVTDGHEAGDKDSVTAKAVDTCAWAIYGGRVPGLGIKCRQAWAAGIDRHGGWGDIEALSTGAVVGGFLLLRAHWGCAAVRVSYSVRAVLFCLRCCFCA